MNFAFESVKGKRGKNEDFYGNSKEELFVVADGLGGHPAGEVASKIAVNTAIAEYKKAGKQNIQALEQVFEKANGEVYKKSKEKSEWIGMGTTMTVVLLNKSNVVTGNVGDSRAYLLSSENLQLISKDDRSLGGRLTQALGISEKCPPVNNSVVDIETGDKILLCSDGLSDYVHDGQIEKIIAMDKNPKILAEMLVNKALDLKSTDNVTVGMIVN